jgi:hypothetical protein
MTVSVSLEPGPINGKIQIEQSSIVEAVERVLKKIIYLLVHRSK